MKQRGRPRIYENNTAKVAAYRQRRAENQEALIKLAARALVQPDVSALQAELKRLNQLVHELQENLERIQRERDGFLLTLQTLHYNGSL